MFRSRSAKQFLMQRRGSILLVVITFLALFAVVGLSFALFAESENTASRTHMEAFKINDLPGRANPDEPNPQEVANLVLAQMIYDTQDTPSDVKSGFRGHSLARLMYSRPGGLSPYNGQGIFNANDETALNLLPIPFTDPIFGAQQILRSQVFNYGLYPGLGVFFEPEFSWARQAPGGPVVASGTPQTQLYKAVNAGYTYPDAKDLMLAVFDTTTPGQIGRVLKASYQRPGENYNLTSDGYFTAQGRFQMLRPRPLDQLVALLQYVIASGDAVLQAKYPDAATDLNLLRTNVTGGSPLAANAEIARQAEKYGTFAYPPFNSDGTVTGDVQNFPYPSHQQHNDSFWMYPGGPIRKWNGKFYTAIVAPMVIDLNGRVNLSMAGNTKFTATGNPGHSSDKGIGPWEINPAYVMRAFDLTSSADRIPDFLPEPTGRPHAATSARQLLAGAQFLSAGNPPQNLNGRYGPNTSLNPAVDRYTSTGSTSFNNGLVPPFYSRVNFDGTTTSPVTPSTDIALPVGQGNSPYPSYPNTRYFDQTGQVIELSNHPAQYNPNNYVSAPGAAPMSLPLQDIFTLGTRYGGRMDRYGSAVTAKLAPRHTLSANFTVDNGGMPATPTPFNPLNTTVGNINPLRTTSLDGADLVRMLTTPQSSSLSRPELVVPAINDASGTIATCRLGAIDMNRPLPDYRQDLTAMLGPDNLGNFAAAQIARQRFARDIYVRLAACANLIDGVNTVYVNDPAQPDYGYVRFLTDSTTVNLPPPYPPNTNLNLACRALAQIAANMVDQVDADDIATTFTFWPMQSPGAPNMGNAYIVLPNGLPNIGVAGTNLVLGDQIGLHTVFGTELPRVLLSEALAEVTNDRRDWHPVNNPMGPPMNNAGERPAQHNFEKRFFIELYNPMRTDGALSESGRARLAYPAGAFNGTPAFPQHQIIITDHRPNLIDDPLNVTGSPWHATADPAGANIRAKVDDYTYDGTDSPEDPHQIGAIPGYVVPPLAGTTAANIERYTIQPHDAPAGNGTNRQNLNGFAMLGPVEDYPGVNSMAMPMGLGATIRIQRAPGAAAGSNPIPKPVPPNGLQFDAGTRDGMRLQPGAMNSVLNPMSVYLRRTAVPYAPPNDPLDPNFDPTQPINPYITVDRIENLQPVNTVRFDNVDARNPLPDTALMQTVGRLHPFASELQGPQGMLGAAMSGLPPANTFYNSNTGLITPVRWLAHLDRQLLNPVELASTSAVAASQLTRFFATALPMQRWNAHTAESILLPNTVNGITAAPGLGLTVRGVLARALDFLTVRSFTSGTPVGGREQGRININTAWHPSVLRSLLDGSIPNDPHSGSIFLDQTTGTNDGVIDPTPANINSDITFSFWGRMIGQGLPGNEFRSPAFPNVGPADRPYRSLAGSPNTQETILRAISDGAMPPTRFFSPLYNHNASAAVGDPTHVTLMTEPLQKAWNSMTTTSDQFLVIMTISFVEVNPASPGITTVGAPVFLGRELYREVPGDLRTKFMAVVDRTSLGLDPLNTTLQASEKPWFTRLAADVQPGATQIQVEAIPVPDPSNPSNPPTPCAVVDGILRPIIDPQRRQIRIGFGDRAINQGDGEVLITDTQVPQMAPNSQFAIPMSWTGSICTIQLPTGIAVTQYHPAGSPVSNVLLGNPGPQPSFDVNNARYSGVVPLSFLVPRGQ